MKWLATTLVLLCCVAAIGGWRLHAGRRRQTPVIGVVKPVRGNLETAVTATGTLYPSHSVDIKYDGQEIVQRLSVKEGDHVKAGQVLAVMDTRVLNHARLQNVETADKDTASLVQAKDAYNREQALFREGIVARSDFETTRATYESLVHQRMADQEAIRQTAQQMDLAVLRSPMNGTVVTIYVHAGEMLGSATAVAALGPNTSVSKPTNVLMTVVEDGPLEVYAGVNAADLASLTAGQDAEISIDAFQPQVFHGRVRRISLEPVVVNNVTTYQAIVTLTDGDPRFRIGLPADVMLLKRLATGHEMVPTQALVTRPDGDAVCSVHATPSAAAGKPTRIRPVFTPVAVAAKTEDAVALANDLPSATWVIENPAVCQAPAQSEGTLQVDRFNPNPSFSDTSLAKSKQSQAITNLPPASPKGWLQSLLGL